MRVKICGITRSKDLTAALREGADAVGFVVGSPSSGRNLSLAKARGLMNAVPVFSTKVAVTSAQDLRTIIKVCSKLSPDALQLHNHTPKLIRSIRKKQPATKLILATAIGEVSPLNRAKRTAKYSDAVLADTAGLTGMGGTGRTHDWHLTAKIRRAIHPHPLILAGGLTPGNVRTAINMVKPFAVDVSSGVERTIGVKDHGKIREFIMNSKENAA